MMSALRRWFGINDTLPELDPELEEAKAQLNHERGLYRQTLTRVDVNSRNLMRQWESAGEMMREKGQR